MVTSFVLLSEKNIKKLKRKSQRIPKKQRQPKNREKRGPKVEQYLRSTYRAPFELCLCADFRLVPNHIPAARIN